MENNAPKSYTEKVEYRGKEKKGWRDSSVVKRTDYSSRGIEPRQLIITCYSSSNTDDVDREIA